MTTLILTSGELVFVVEPESVVNTLLASSKLLQLGRIATDRHGNRHVIERWDIPPKDIKKVKK